MKGPGFGENTRRWALDEYVRSRPNHPSRAACVAVLAATIGAHVNTVGRWVAAEHGPSRPLSPEDAAAARKALEAENERLRAENLALTARLGAVAPSSIQALR